MHHAPPLLFLVLLVAHPAWAQVDVRTAQATATGQAAAAHADDNTALSINPAAMGLSQRYAMGVVGGFWDGRDWRAGFTAVDSQTNPEIAIGVAYQRWRATGPLSPDELPGWVVTGQDIPTKRRFDVLTGAFALPLLDNRLSFGVNGSVSIMRHAVLGSETSGDLDAGIAGRPTKKWAVGVAVRNMLPQFVVTDGQVGLVAGTRYAWDEHTSVMLDADIPLTAVDGLPLSLRGGAEWGDGVRHFAVGYRYEGPAGEHWASLGAGLWSDPESSDSGSRAGLHYAMAVPFHGLAEEQKRLLAITHTLSITITPTLQEAQ